MSPAVVQVGAGSAAKDVKRESGTARLLGSGMCLDFIFFKQEANSNGIVRVCRYRRVDGFPSR